MNKWKFDWDVKLDITIDQCTQFQVIVIFQYFHNTPMRLNTAETTKIFEVMDFNCSKYIIMHNCDSEDQQWTFGISVYAGND